MELALTTAAAADHRASPNPTVGAVLATAEGTVIATGASRPVGGAHAEVEVLAAAGDRARGATLYVTLEPCSHTGRTPPCADAVVAAGVARVVAAMEDPNPLVRGQGAQRLREAGIEVEVGLMAEGARRLHRIFATWVTRRTPFVTLKFAASLDGRVATAGGQSQWITGTESRRLAHLLRHRHDAVLVGSGTVLADDPELTTRLDGHAGARQARRVVLDSTLRTPPGARLLSGSAAGAGPVLVVTCAGAEADRARALEAAGAEVLELPGRDGRVDLVALLDHLGATEVSSVLVEGGPTVHGAFHDAGLVDGVVALLSPRLIGGTAAPAAVGGRGVESLAAAHLLDEVEVARAGGDVVVTGYCNQQPAY